jgi:hypothetical protein
MSDIFYSEVDPHLWLELNARAKTGRYDRSNESMNFMLEKIANVMVVPYKIESGEFGTSKSVIREAILGGHTVREGEYLPSSQYGFLTDRNYNLRELGFNADDQIIEKYNKPLNNTSRRIPPYITSVDMTNGDHSMSLLNSVTINFIVPNPERDLNYIESIYFRPGRNVDVIIEHPNSAVITMDTTKGKLSSDSLISAWERSDEYIKLKQRLDSSITEDGLVEDIKQERALFMKRLETFRHLNLVKFEGIIQSFTMDYQSDMSVQCTIQIIGTSNIYADIELIINSNNKSTGSDTETQNKTNTSTTSTTTTSNTTDPNSITTLGFFENLYKEVDNAISESNKRKKDKT